MLQHRSLAASKRTLRQSPTGLVKPLTGGLTEPQQGTWLNTNSIQTLNQLLHAAARICTLPRSRSKQAKHHTEGTAAATAMTLQQHM
jgi:hypothetical protein